MAILPTEKSKPKVDLRDFTILLYGQPKIGKSTFCSQADHALFLATEAGLNSLSVYQVPILTWQDFLAACREIAGEKHEFRTIVIDTIDNLYKLCVDHILKKHSIQHQSDLEYGKGYELVNSEFGKRLTSLSLLPYGLIMVSHAVEKEVKTRTGKENRIAPTLPNSARKIVVGMADLVLYVEMTEDRDDQGVIADYHRVIHTKPTTIYEAGDRTGRLPETLPLNYATFAAEMKKPQAALESPHAAVEAPAETVEAKLPEAVTAAKPEPEPTSQASTSTRSAKSQPK